RRRGALITVWLEVRVLPGPTPLIWGFEITKEFGPFYKPKHGFVRTLVPSSFLCQHRSSWRLIPYLRADCAARMDAGTRLQQLECGTIIEFVPCQSRNPASHYLCYRESPKCEQCVGITVLLGSFHFFQQVFV